MIFYLVELDAYKPGAATFTYSQGHGTTPHGTQAPYPDPVTDSAVIKASDMGYRSRSTDAGGVVSYPPYVNQAFAISRQVHLDPAGSAVGAAAGQVVLANHENAFDTIASVWNSDGRAVRVLRGTKTLDAARGYYTDPAYSTLAVFFAGMATPWFLTDTELQVPVRDATYWLEQPLQTALYLGTGTYEGPAALTGQPKPKTRGTANNVTPLLIDAVNLIYQYTDAAGTISALYEGAATPITFQVNTGNLYVGTTTAGQYRTDNSRGLFQLGSIPAATITVDVFGNFPTAGAQTTLNNIARYLLAEDCSLPAANIDTGSFTAAPAFAGGVHFASSDQVDGVTAVSRVLASFGAKLIPKRSGALSVIVPTAIPAFATPVAAFGFHNVVSLTPAPLSAPPYRFRVAYGHNYTVQTSDVSVSATAVRRAYVASADRYSGWSSTAILTAYRRPGDPQPVGGALNLAADALTVADTFGALWGVHRRLYTMVVPIEQGIARDIGDVVRITWPADNLATGQMGRIMGEAFRSQESTIAFTILV